MRTCFALSYVAGWEGGGGEFLTILECHVDSFKKYIGIRALFEKQCIIYIYIYIHAHMCVCVCVYERAHKSLTNGSTFP